MLSKYIKYSFLLLLCFVFVSSYGQGSLQNLLNQMQDNDVKENFSLVEQGNYFYFISRQQAGPANLVLMNLRASQYFINKYDKNTLQRVNQRYIAGDTLQNDSIVNAAYIALKNDQFYLLYGAVISESDTFRKGPLLYQRLDMDFNTLAPEKRVEDSARIDATLLDCSKPMDNGRFFMGFWPYNIPGVPRTNYLMLDSMGNTIAIGEAAQNGQLLGPMRGFTPLGNHRYLVSGYGFAGVSDVNPEGNNFGWCLVNDNMQILDTFKDKYGAVQDPVALSYFHRPGTILLPGGSLVTATGTASVPGALGGESDYPLIRKHTAATRYGIDKMVVSGPVDNTDTAHENLNLPVSAVYNAYDNTIYYTSVTHMNFYGLAYAANSDKGYLEVISFDTNLNIKWKKYFKISGIAAKAKSIISPDGRPGAIITGFDLFSENNKIVSKNWVYYITDATVSDPVPTGIAEQLHVDNNIKIYPNPAADIIHIVAEKVALKSVTICDITGRVLLSKSLSKQAESMDISTFSKGLYLLKCEDKKGGIFVNKVMKE